MSPGLPDDLEERLREARLRAAEAVLVRRPRRGTWAEPAAADPLCPVCGSEMFRQRAPGSSYWQCRRFFLEASHRAADEVSV